MRKAFSVAVLVLALGCPAFAGIIHNPEPQPVTATTQEPAGGEIPNPPTAVEIVLSLLSGVLPLL
ncbi:MAG TPA: hypothetical protein VN228_11405 [Pyrinomonadaceae bacterium]|nr:hypothetical protein [Pyrinomonadaceae bacterium]